MQQLRLYREYRAVLRRAGVRGLPHVVEGGQVSLSRALRSLAERTGGAAWLVADENTVAAAFELIESLAPRWSTILPGSPEVVPAVETADRIAADAVAGGARVMVVAGGGTLTDLAKYAALKAGLELVAIPTAASVDAYTSARSALRIDGYHRTPAAAVPQAIVIDPALIRAAPRALTLAGLGDLVAKLIARLDWELAHMVTGESFSLREATWADRAARTALARLRRGGTTAAAMPAMDALLLTGEAMRAAGSSRPCASSEHTLAHLWEIAVEFPEPMLHYHGLLVARASQVVVPAYRRIFARLRREGVRPDAKWPAADEATWESRVPADMRPFIGKMREESAGRGLSDAVIVSRRRALGEHRDRILALADRSLDAAERGLAALDRAGLGDVLPEVPDHWVTRGLEWVRYLRNRYSAFDLAWEEGWEREVIES